MVLYILSESGFSGAIDTEHGRHQSSHDADTFVSLLLELEREQEWRRLELERERKWRRLELEREQKLRRLLGVLEWEQKWRRLAFLEQQREQERKRLAFLELEREQEWSKLELEWEQILRRLLVAFLELEREQKLRRLLVAFLELEREQKLRRLLVELEREQNWRRLAFSEQQRKQERKRLEQDWEHKRKRLELEQELEWRRLELKQEQERKRLECVYNQIQKLKLLLFKSLFLELQNTVLDYILSDNKCRKYPCIDSILYLLWQSGNIELNPGPARSIKYRNWLYDTCSKVRKSIVEIHNVPVANNIWKKKPNNWPSEEKYGNPRMMKMHEVNEFLGTLLKYCEDNYIKLDQNIQTEVKLWQEDHIDAMLHLHLIRTCLENISSEVPSLPSHCNRLQVGSRVFEITFAANLVDMQEQHSGLYLSEATRKLASILIKLYFEKNPQKKHDNIWKVKPAEWSDSVRFFDPFNGGRRETDGEDEKLVYELLKCCDIKANIQKKAIIPDFYQPLINAWKARDTNQVTIFFNEIVVPKKIQNALEALDEEHLLYDPKVTDKLMKMGVHIRLANNKRKLEVASNEGKRKRLDAVLSSASTDELRDDIFIAQVATPDSTQDVNQDATEENKEAFEAIMNALGKDPSSCFTDIFLGDFSN